MKILILVLSLFLISSNSWGDECDLYWDDAFGLQMEGNCKFSKEDRKIIKVMKILKGRLSERITNLEAREYIGEYSAHCSLFSSGCRINHWYKFSESDIQDKVDGYTKINGKWYANENIIFYEDQYAERKKEIEKRLDNENKTP